MKTKISLPVNIFINPLTNAPTGNVEIDFDECIASQKGYATFFYIIVLYKSSNCSDPMIPAIEYTAEHVYADSLREGANAARSVAESKIDKSKQHIGQVFGLPQIL